ncbi:MAG: methyl-accepting chemotaxis protein [Albidovulum sp.]
MRALDNISLAIKLPLIFGTLALAALLTMGITSYHFARGALLRAGEAQAHATLDAKTQQVSVWYSVVSADLKALASSPQSARILRDFRSAWDRIGNDAPEMLRQKFIAENPHPRSERYRLKMVSDLSDYSIAHGRYHEEFVSVLAEKGYHDVLLIDVNGDILYTVAKEGDLGENIFTGQLRSSELAGVARKVMQRPDADVLFSDFTHYAPSDGAVANFVAAPIKSRSGAVVGALVFQISATLVTEVLEHGGHDKIIGLQYLVGRDHRLRSHTGGMNTGALDVRSNLGVLKTAFKQDVVVGREPGLFGTQSLVVTRRIDLQGLDLVLVYELPQDILLAPAATLLTRIGLGAAISISVFALMVFLLARGLSRPLVRSADAMTAIAAGDYSIGIPDSGRKDEIGIIARSLEAFRDSLARSVEIARDAAFKSAAFEGSSAALMIVDQDYRVTYVNPSVHQLFTKHAAEFRIIAPDFDPLAIVGQQLDGFQHDDHPISLRLDDAPNLPFRTEIRIGEARFALDINEVEMEGQGRIGLVVEWRDVTIERMNRAVLTAIDRNLATAEFDASGILIEANAKMLTLLGKTAEEVMGQGHSDLINHGGDENLGAMDVGEMLHRGESVFGRFWTQFSGGREGVIDGGFSPVHDNDGQLLKILLMGTDVTEAELGLRAAEQRRREMEHAQTKVVDALRVGLKNLSDGNLTARLEDGFEADYETLRHDFNMAIEQLAHAMAAVMANATEIEGEALEIEKSAEDLTMRTERQAATLEQTAAALDQLTISVQSAATGAAEASLVVENARASAESSGAVVEEAVKAMGEISSSSDRIARIIGVIDDISFQTNLLALNAGVEAARAGDAGRGFAVVAAEVRALAQRSSDAAREIDTLISASSGQVRRGVELVGETGHALKSIVTSVTNIASCVSEIAASSQEQSAGLAEINLAVNQIDQVTQQNAALFGQTAVASQSLTRGAKSLTATMARFRIGKNGTSELFAADDVPSKSEFGLRTEPAAMWRTSESLRKSQAETEHTRTIDPRAAL